MSERLDFTDIPLDHQYFILGKHLRDHPHFGSGRRGQFTINCQIRAIAQVAQVAFLEGSEENLSRIQWDDVFATIHQLAWDAERLREVSP